MAIDLGNGNDNFTVTNAGGESVRGFGGSDTLIGGPGNDTLSGNEGDDIIVGSGNDFLSGGQGNDAVIASNSATGDVLYGNKGTDILIGSAAGGVLMFGGKGNDLIYAGEIDTVTSAGGDLIFGDLGDDLIFSNGNGTLTGGGVASFPDINDGNDTLVGGFGNQLLASSSGEDTFLFQSAVSRVIGGRTVLEGGYGGQDVIRNFKSGGTGNDKIVFRDLVSGDTVKIADLGANGSAISLSGSVPGLIIVEGTALSNLLTSGNNDITVNGTVIDFSNGSFDASTNLFTYVIP